MPPSRMLPLSLVLVLPNNVDNAPAGTRLRSFDPLLAFRKVKDRANSVWNCDCRWDMATGRCCHSDIGGSGDGSSGRSDDGVGWKAAAARLQTIQTTVPTAIPG